MRWRSETGQQLEKLAGAVMDTIYAIAFVAAVGVQAPARGEFIETHEPSIHQINEAPSWSGNKRNPSDIRRGQFRQFRFWRNGYSNDTSKRFVVLEPDASFGQHYRAREPPKIYMDKTILFATRGSLKTGFDTGFMPPAETTVLDGAELSPREYANMIDDDQNPNRTNL